MATNLSFDRPQDKRTILDPFSRDSTPAAGGVSSADLVAWALRQSMPNQWLEFPDILLYCQKKEIPLKILVWKKGKVSR